MQNDAEQKVIRIILDTCHIQTAIRHKPAHLHAWKRPVPGEQKDKTLEHICREGCTRTEPAASLTWELQRWSKEKEHVLKQSRNPNHQINDLRKTAQPIPLQHKINLFKVKNYSDPTIKFLYEGLHGLFHAAFSPPLSTLASPCYLQELQFPAQRAAGIEPRSEQAASSASVSAKPTTSSNHEIFSVSSCSETLHKALANRKTIRLTIWTPLCLSTAGADVRPRWHDVKGSQPGHTFRSSGIKFACQDL